MTHPLVKKWRKEVEEIRLYKNSVPNQTERLILNEQGQVLLNCAMELEKHEKKKEVEKK